MNYDRMFEDLMADKFPETLENGDRVVRDIEKEYLGLGEEERSRRSEEAYIRDEITKAEKLLRVYKKNVKNHRLVKHNASRAAKRQEFKKRISELRLRLEEIKQERK